MPHLTKTAPSGFDISARPALTYLLQLLNTLSNLIGLIHGPSCYLPLKPFSLSHFQQPRVLQLVTAVVSKPFVETPSTHWTFHRAVPSPFFLEIELTENQCRSVSNPVPKGFLPRFHVSTQGMERTCEAPSNEAPHMILGYRQGRLPTYLQSTVAHLRL